MALELMKWNQELLKTNTLKEWEYIFDLFLWGSDPYEKYHPDILFNGNHLLGMLVCGGMSPSVHKDITCRFQLMETPPCEMNLKQIKDTITNLQFEWPLFLLKSKNNDIKIEGIKIYLQSCMHRIGELIHNSHLENVLNDVQDTCYHSNIQKKLTCSAIRRLLGSVLLLNRHIDLYEMSEEIKPCQFATGVTAYHHEASTENYHKLCMHYFLPVAAKLHYKHDFPGMYNDVSQAVFFHDNEYKRTNREPYTSTNPIHMLPSICLLYPEITIKFEDDFFDPTVSQGWYWILLPHRIYLVSPEPKVYFSEDLSALVKIYVDSTQEPEQPFEDSEDELAQSIS
jgi:hypothetical protein